MKKMDIAGCIVIAGLGVWAMLTPPRPMQVVCKNRDGVVIAKSPVQNNWWRGSDTIFESPRDYRFEQPPQSTCEIDEVDRHSSSGKANL